MISVLMLGACGFQSPERSGAETPSPSPSASLPASVANAIVYVDEPTDLFFYDVAADSVRRLPEDGEKGREVSPRFTDPGTVTYGAGRRIVEIDVASRVQRTIRTVPGDVHVLDWNPDRTMLAVLFDRGDPSGVGLTLRLEAFGGPESHEIRRFKPWLGRGGIDDDEVAVTWSPDGTKLLVVLTPLDTVSKQTLFVLDSKGSDLMSPRFGTMARWAPDSRTVYYRDLGDDRSWHRLDVPAGTVTDVDMRPGAFRPEISPDGSLVAYDTVGDSPTTYVYDLKRGTERTVATGVLGPLWLSADALAATYVRLCAPGSDCEGWVSERRAAKIPLSGDIAPLALRSTVSSAELLYG